MQEQTRNKYLQNEVSETTQQFEKYGIYYRLVYQQCHFIVNIWKQICRILI